MTAVLPKLTDSELEDALYLFAQGKNTSQVIDAFLDKNPDWDTSPAFRSQLREQLRPVNPADSRFSKTKYGELYASARQAVLDVLREEARGVFRSVINSLTDNLDEVDVISARLLRLLDNTSEADITSNSEFVNTVKAFTSLQKVKVDGAMAVSAMVDSLARLPSLGESE